MEYGARPSGLVIDMHQGDVLSFGGAIKIRFLRKSGRVTRVIVSAPPQTKVMRETERLRGADRELAHPLLGAQT